MNKVGVIGGGAAGMMAAGYAAHNGADVTLFEHRDRLGLKLGITGKGRCNVTNNCDTSEFIRNVPTNPRFMYTAISRFSPQDTMEFFEELGVQLKTERGSRVFPVSDKASDIVRALRGYCEKVHVIFGDVSGLAIENGICRGLICGGKRYDFDSVIVCTGGMSYTATGSRGAGYAFARQAGIEIVPLKPSLVPMTVKEKWCSELMGLSLKNVSVKITDSISGKELFEDFGEMLFTHFGLSGPVVLSASSYIKNVDFSGGRYKFIIDLKPALDADTLDLRLLRDFSENINRDFINALDALLPQKIIPIVARLSGIDAHKKVNLITKEERAALLCLIKGFTLTLSGYRPLEEAIITSGGVSVKELNPKTMEAKKVVNLFFAGEVIDVDAYTGGFNLQIAFSTARLAAENAVMRECTLS